MMKIFADFEGINTFNNYYAIKELSSSRRNETKYTTTFIRKNNICVKEDFYFNLFAFTKSDIRNGLQKVLLKLFDNTKTCLYQKSINSLLKYITNKNAYSIFGIDLCKVAKLFALSIVVFTYGIV